MRAAGPVVRRWRLRVLELGSKDWSHVHCLVFPDPIRIQILLRVSRVRLGMEDDRRVQKRDCREANILNFGCHFHAQLVEYWYEGYYS